MVYYDELWFMFPLSVLLKNLIERVISIKIVEERNHSIAKASIFAPNFKNKDKV